MRTVYALGVCNSVEEFRMAERVCPWWAGYLLASPVRRLLQKPEVICGDYVRAGMTALDVGCAMGFFSLPLAELVGPQGKVICVDLQERMLSGLRKRAQKAGVLDRIETRVCPATGLGIDDLQGTVDFAVAFAMLHETPDMPATVAQIADTLTPSGRFLIAEPSGHVSAETFDATIAAAEGCGLHCADRPKITRSMSALMEKPA